MATTRGKGSGTGAGAAKTAAKRTRTRAPEDDISGVAAPEAAAAPGTGVAQSPPAEAPRPTRRKAPGSGVAADAGASAPAAPAARTPAKSAAKSPAKSASKTSARSAPATAETPKKRGGKRETYVETAARRRQEKEVDQLAVDLRAFAVARPGGWNHDDWVSFLEHLSTQGHDISDAEGIGRRLEQERLGVILSGVQGLGPKRVQSLVDQFGTLWSLRHAGADDVAAVSGMTRPLAERVVEDLRTRFP
ncbi:helix-hairpin-helix domain-containing protein [Longimicrobium sp.]|uniref:helix-hairpin-helix domain-containing protein n=1 Tax=Longimicrobium sp. TaxID=2029185 RepID=UPI002E369FEC|nr:helix-hairpin-helix domain-containing protein [Longimicrobium sp.]HEX6041806.1 helix-hairpin-helix domain-containing protein [Longimicrobium sp.]